MTRGRTVLALLATAAVAAAGAGPAAGDTPPALVFPDLVSDPPERPYVRDHEFEGVHRLLVRFDGFVHNAGPGALEIEGNPLLAVRQRVYAEDGSAHAWTPGPGEAAPTVLYEATDGHQHWHLMRAAEYSLWTRDRSAQVAPAEKVGFCLYDIERIETLGPSSPVYDDATNGGFCEWGHPEATSLRMGVSAGWRDVYGGHLALQWVDASSTPPGRYVLASRVDPTDVIHETDETNNGYAFAGREVVVPGYVALPVGPVEVRRDARRTITLAADAFAPEDDTLGERRFKIVTPPDHGTLDQAVGDAFRGPSVVYTPDPGYSGPDSFEYVALDAYSEFPRFPAAAAASLVVGDGPATSVAISGAPASQVAGTSARLTATVAGVEGGVTWSVDGVEGGSATTGTIDADGLYIAPASPPPGGVVRIRATSVEAPWAYGEVTVAIASPPPQFPAPDVSAGGSPGAVLGHHHGHPGRDLGGAAPGAPGGDRSLRLVITLGSGARSSWSGWRAAFPPVRQIARDGLRPGTRAAIAWRGRVWRGRGDVVHVARSLVRRFGTPSGAVLSRPVLERNGPWLVAHVVPGRAGTVLVVARHGRTRLLRCEVRTPARRPLTCGATLPAALRKARALDVRVAVRLSRPGGATGTVARARV